MSDAWEQVEADDFVGGSPWTLQFEGDSDYLETGFTGDIDFKIAPGGAVIASGTATRIDGRNLLLSADNTATAAVAAALASAMVVDSQFPGRKVGRVFADVWRTNVSPRKHMSIWLQLDVFTGISEA